MAGPLAFFALLLLCFLAVSGEISVHYAPTTPRTAAALAASPRPLPSPLHFSPRTRLFHATPAGLIRRVPTTATAASPTPCHGPLATAFATVAHHQAPPDISLRFATMLRGRSSQLTCATTFSARKRSSSGSTTGCMRLETIVPPDVTFGAAVRATRLFARPGSIFGSKVNLTIIGGSVCCLLIARRTA